MPCGEQALLRRVDTGIAGQGRHAARSTERLSPVTDTVDVA